MRYDYRFACAYFATEGVHVILSYLNGITSGDTTVNEFVTASTDVEVGIRCFVKFGDHCGDLCQLFSSGPG